MRPLRPDTDLRLGRPLPYQLANQPRPPPKADCSFDLAILCGISLGFPRLSPTQGQVVTCYSPGRHYTQGLLPFPVRLACVRHAASVDSEPGSNSHLKPESVWVDRRPPSAETKVLSCEYVQTLRPEHLFLTTGTFNLLSKTDPLPPERCAFRSALISRRDFGVLETCETKLFCETFP